MPKHREIRAGFDRETIAVYQAYSDAIADAAVAAGRFVRPFSFGRMTWIKPSFLWLMQRSRWATKPNQTRILAVRVRRTAWDKALSLGVLTSFTPGVHRSADDWRANFDAAPVHVQWDPERSIHGKKLEHRAIQVGIGRTLIEQYASQWVEGVSDITPLSKRIHQLKLNGDYQRARALLPQERVYPVAPSTAARLAMD